MANAIAIIDADRAGTRATNIDAAGRLQVKATVSPVIAWCPVAADAFCRSVRVGTGIRHAPRHGKRPGGETRIKFQQTISYCQMPYQSTWIPFP